MSFGTTLQTINNQRVKIKRDAIELTLTSDVKLRKTRTLHRTYTRAGPVDAAEWRLDEIEFTAELTELLLTQIQTDESIDANSKLAFETWTIEGISTSGSAGDNTSDVVSAVIINSEELAPDRGTAKIQVKMRILGAAV